MVLRGMVEVVAITSKVEASGGESGWNASGWMTMDDVRRGQVDVKGGVLLRTWCSNRDYLNYN